MTRVSHVNALSWEGVDISVPVYVYSCVSGNSQHSHTATRLLPDQHIHWIPRSNDFEFLFGNYSLKKVECRLQTIYSESATGSVWILPYYTPLVFPHDSGPLSGRAHNCALQRSVTARPCSHFLTYIYWICTCILVFQCTHTRAHLLMPGCLLANICASITAVRGRACARVYTCGCLSVVLSVESFFYVCM